MKPSQLAQRLGHEFSDSELLDLAFRHRSSGLQNNERLEYLGDAVLGMIIAEALFERFSGAKEGDLTRARARLVKEPTLAEIARGFGLGQFLNLGSGELKSGGRDRDSILSDALEAIIGAIYLDAGFSVVRSVVISWYAERLETMNPLKLEKDPKTRLQEWLQSQGQPLPVYRVEQETGEPHDREYQVSCSVQGNEQPYMGQGTGRRRAEQMAAQAALEALGQ